MSDNLDLNALRDIASAATKGPWTHTGNEDECGTILGAVKRKGSVRTYPHVIDLVDRREDGDFIAAFDPPTVLTLIDHIDHLRDAAQHAEIHAAEMRERALAAEAGKGLDCYIEMTAERNAAITRAEAAEAKVARVEAALASMPTVDPFKGISGPPDDMPSEHDYIEHGRWWLARDLRAALKGPPHD